MVFLYFDEGKLLSKDKWNLALTSSNVGPHQLNERKFA